MIAILGHRGPDGYGLYRDHRVGLGHVRLSIIDLATGDQPIRNEDGSVWIAFNGEIFNYVELRRELEGLGHCFYTMGDTETIVHAYEQWGEDAWARLNGQFAFALWDKRRERLHLVRDPVGILPLFYAETESRLLFGSEVKAIFASGHLQPRLDGPGLRQVFTRWSATPPRTVFEGVRSVPPGGSVRFDSTLSGKPTTWWRAQPGSSPDDRAGLEDAANRLEQKLETAVTLRLRADVPVGAYLSGGLDSSYIASLIRSADRSPLQTFAIRFEDRAFDETAPQRRMAELLGTEHHEVLCRAADIAAALPEVVWHCETPLLRTAPVPLFLLSDLVRRTGMKVVLTGEGADELFAGYNIFKEDKVRRFWARRPESARRPALLTRLYPYLDRNEQEGTEMWKAFFRKGLMETGDPFYSHRIRWDNTGWTERFLSAEVPGRDEPEPQRDLLDALPADWPAWSPLDRAQMIEIMTFMSPYLLCSQGDRVAMAHGVEVRYPFLDPDVIGLSWTLPGRRKLRGLRDKYVLRVAASRRLPDDIAWRPKKPYRAPMSSVVFAQDTPEYVDDLLSARRLREFGVVEPRAAELLVQKARRRGGRLAGEREEMALIAILTIQLLVQSFLREFDGRVAEGEASLAKTAPSVLEDLAGVKPA